MGNYFLVGQKISTCTSDGSFTTSPPTCVRQGSFELPKLEHGTAVHKGAMGSNPVLVKVDTCKASSELSNEYTCINAFNQVREDGPGRAWASKNEGAGASILVIFDSSVRITSFKFMQRKDPNTHVKNFDLVFSDGSTHSYIAANNNLWQSFNVSSSLSATVSANISFKSLYSKNSNQNSGAAEVQFFTDEKLRPLHNSTMKYKCDSGYFIGDIEQNDGPRSATMQSDGEWKPMKPICIRKCPMPSPPNNGSVAFSSGKRSTELDNSPLLNAQVSFSCGTKFKLQGASKLTCTSHGNWSSPFPVCTRWCDIPSQPPNGDLGVYGTTIDGKALDAQTSVKYSCRVNYVLQGKSEAQCTGKGIFSSRVPICVRQGDFQTLANGITKHEGRTGARPEKIVVQSCTSSTMLSKSYTCMNAFDGNHRNVPNQAWSSKGEGPGAWIEAKFETKSNISMFQFIQRHGAVNYNKNIELSFDNGIVERFTLKGNDFVQEFQLAKAISTSSVRITIKSVYVEGVDVVNNNGANEITFYSPGRVRPLDGSKTIYSCNNGYFLGNSSQDAGAKVRV